MRFWLTSLHIFCCKADLTCLDFRFTLKIVFQCIYGGLLDLDSNMFEGNGEDREVFKQTYESGFDIIIDDGLHKHWSQTKTFDNFFPILKDGGVYVIEDIDCRRDDVEIIKNHISSIDIRYCTSIDTTDPESPEKSYQQPYGVIRK